jgi:hypothetical protein
MIRKVIQMVLAFFSSLGAITVNEPDCSGLERSPYDPVVYDQTTIDQALQDGQLDADMALQLHQTHQSWEITVEHNR